MYVYRTPVHIFSVNREPAIAALIKKRVQTEVRTRKYRCPKAYLRIKPPRSSMASQKALAKRGSLAAMRALVAIQPEGVPVS